MSEQVKVADVETIERFRAQLIQAAETFGLAIEEAEGDIERTLALEPRHFGALSGLGMIYAQREQYEAAVKAFERGLKVNPHMPGARQTIQDLRKRIGQDI